MSTQKNGFITRVVTALFLVSGFFSLIWIEQIQAGFFVAVTIIAAIGIKEFYDLMRAEGIELKSNIGVVVGMLVAASGVLGRLEITNLLLVAGCIGIVFFKLIRPDVTIAGLLSSVAGVVYIGWTAAHVVLMHSIEGIGSGLVTILIVAVALTDCGAYLVGKAIGKHKLAPIVSPNKTWEGALGGFIFTGIGMIVLWKLCETQDWTSYPDWTVLRYFGFGALLSIASQVGDLMESAIKRDAGVKDSGTLLPGHGGVLDRCDGFLFAGPILYYIVAL